MLKYWIRLQNLSSDSFLKEVFLCNMELDGISSWSKNINFILTELNLKYYWARIPDNNTLINKAIKILKTRFQELWKTKLYCDERKNIQQNNKLRTYRKFKIQFEMEDYLLLMTNSENRCNLLKFRSSAHSLRIETGRRHPYIPVEDRKCNLCDLEEIEDEKHFLLSCSKYKLARVEFLEKIYKIFPDLRILNNEEKFVWLMASKNPDVMKTLAEFITRNMKIRQNTI